ncbi:hypothetical protein IDJ77_13620 [Mucilaginibacter sp. ZT4R22]|uniref:Uncharacterized protein n=1 Tax=Mucilaginibacter pankratovii TaxID=2772110 RepID=A0ABR7WRC7_9SPHI|nr:hypothetical protein [Mucilaginibacter pankratovii]MBD1364855.1 hypothetical protein [Mucilaginibacter pankratovii]
MFLNFNIEILDHPYADEPSSVFEQWARMRLEICNDDGESEKIIFDTQWDVKVLVAWVIENQVYLLAEEYPFSLQESSVAEGLHNFYEGLDLDGDSIEEDELLDLVYNYRVRHGLRFAMRGTDIDDVFIGPINGETTISCFNDFSNWNYKVEIDGFLSTINTLSEKLFNIKSQ